MINVADIIRSQLRYEDAASRWGGEEFLALLSDANKATALSVAERIRKAVEDNKVYIDENTSVTHKITIGVSTSVEDLSIDDIIADADKKLYLGKQTGRNKVII